MSASTATIPVETITVEAKLLDECPCLLAYMEKMYARPQAPMRIAAAFASIAA